MTFNTDLLSVALDNQKPTLEVLSIQFDGGTWKYMSIVGDLYNTEGLHLTDFPHLKAVDIPLFPLLGLLDSWQSALT